MKGPSLLVTIAEGALPTRERVVPGGRAGPSFRPTRAVIDLDAVRHNLDVVRGVAGRGVGTIAVVKANAYGHGAVRCARTLEHAGAEALGVALVEGGLGLREAGVTAPLLVLGGLPLGGGPDGRAATPAAAAEAAVAGRMSVVVWDRAAAERLGAAARAVGGGSGLGGAGAGAGSGTGSAGGNGNSGARARVHLTLDTGMGRLGASPDPARAAALAAAIAAVPGVELEGVMTHLARADESEPDALEATRRQLAAFDAAVEAVRAVLPGPARARLWIHAANSAGTFGAARGRYTHCRPGIALYGVAPFAGAPGAEALRPAMRWSTHIALVQDVAAGGTVSYGGRWVAERPSRIAVLPVGYADGYDRRMGRRGEVLVHGRRVPVVGTVCMDLLMADVTDLPAVAEGDEAVLLGDGLGAEELAGWRESIPYEVLTSVSARVPREYVGA
jgi:alanine racemase